MPPLDPGLSSHARDPRRRPHPEHLLPVIVFTSGCLSAFLVNDIVCLVTTPFVLGLTRRLGLRPAASRSGSASTRASAFR